MRHKFATDLLERGANIKQVQELLGHDNLATTEVYLSVTSKGLRDAVNLLEKERSSKSNENEEKWIVEHKSTTYDGIVYERLRKA